MVAPLAAQAMMDQELKAALSRIAEALDPVARAGRTMSCRDPQPPHLMAREMIETESSTAISPSEAVEEKVSLSDRFGLWLGFHNADRDTYFAMIEGYAELYGPGMTVATRREQAVERSVTRGSRSGRVAWPFIQEAAGQLGKKLE